MPTFLSQFLDYTSIFESPGSFWRWSAYAAIAAVLKDSCYISRGASKLFPNIYVLLVADSGGRKGPPVDTAETLVHRTNNTKIISGRASVQGIMDEIARAETDSKTGKVIKAGSAIFFAQELAAGIVSDPESTNILTDIYDYKSNPYKNRLRTGPCFNLDRIVFSMLTASNEDMLRGVFDERVRKGGFLARTFLVFANERRPPNSLMDENYEQLTKTFSGVLKTFSEIANLQGCMEIEPTAKAEYKAWYEPFYNMQATRKDPTGATARIPVGVLKIAMILAANDMSMHINKIHIETAIEQCRGLLPNYQAFMMSTGKSTIKEAGQILFVELIKNKDHSMSRKELLAKHWEDFDGDTLDKLVVTLETSGLVRTLASNGQVCYQLTEAALSTLQNGQGGRG